MSFKIDSFVLLGITTLAFYAFRSKLRVYILLIASLFYIARLDKYALVWVLCSTLAVYCIGLLERGFLEHKNKSAARVVEICGVVLVIGSLITLKYSATFSLNDAILQKLILPIGFSYYAFQAISYIIEVYNEKVTAELNPAYLFLYMCFFPKFVSGPIEKPDRFLYQIKNLDKVKLFDNKRVSIAFTYLLYGFFMKVVIADRLVMYTQKILEFPHIYGSLWLMAGMIMYTFQIYCDFAGYSSLAVGVARLYGITLTENFFAPYLSENIAVFWRRWHVSLSTWLKDYIYIPLGGNRKGTIRKCINMMIVFLICGMWHGVGLSFVVWGFLHGLYQVIYTLVFDKKKQHGKVVRICGIVVTFLLVSVAWIFFGAPSVTYALTFIIRMVTKGTGENPMLAQTTELGVTAFDRNIPVYFLIVFIFDMICVKTRLPFGEALQKLPAVVRYLIEYALILAIFLLGVYGPGYDVSDFMYMEF